MAGQTKAADGYPDRGFAKGKIIDLGATTIATAANANGDLDTTGYQYVTLLGRIGNATTPATAAADITVTLVAYEDDGVTTFPSGNWPGIAPDFTVRSGTLTSPYAYTAARWNLNGLDRVKIVIANNNAAALQGATVVYFLGRS